MLTKLAKTGTQYEYSGEKYKSPAGILLNSRTAVETEFFVSTGVLSYAEGDLLEIEIPEYARFQLGDSAKITVYSPGGIYTFLSRVVAKGEGALVFINPPANRNRFVEKREHPRVEVNEAGTLRTTLASATETNPMIIQNISVSGLGFTFQEELKLGSTYQMEAELGQGCSLRCEVEIMRMERIGEEHYYGARYVGLGTDKVRPLRAFILKKQVELHFERKKKESSKRTFK
ncbi:PilZ domain-containing protein [Paenibacillus rigui]|uniref:PilZ domain-containing protein n=1 Tax=Paenibacillus rigui TaxID=554312 RepID=A0A229US17_9BACL|nr:PilZ domain-containing protein [Paenibacillus rigui]OXM86427.1 PilZ domain-containing protein [Paenibacillus rigui]